ncbi:hypothetical protein ACFQ7W_00735 [Streptomyces niveus]|uniref:hypothetical protein n=1 Tax=Streptomyces niveus TaxID=193462 RepID=UPI0036BB5A38
MATLKTEQTTTHTVTLTEDELRALREAASVALSSGSVSEHTERWRTLRTLGAPVTRSMAAQESRR